MSSEPGERLLIAQVAREVVAREAPEEEEVFDPMADAFFAGTQRRTTKDDDMLGFGVSDVAIALTPVVLAMTDDVVKYLWAETVKAMRGQAAERIHAAVRALFKRAGEGARSPAASAAAATTPGVPVTPALLAEIRKRCVVTAIGLGIKPERAGVLADAVVGQLAVSDGG
jgi:hypothetical protein